VGRTPFVTSHWHSLSRRDADSSSRPLGHGGSGASCSIRTAAPAAAHAADDAIDGSPRRPSAVPGRGAEGEHGRLPPQDLRSRDRRHRHRLDLDVDTRLINVDLQEHVADAQRRALAMGDDDLDLVHVGHYRGVNRLRFHSRDSGNEEAGRRSTLPSRRHFPTSWHTRRHETQRWPAPGPPRGVAGRTTLIDGRGRSGQSGTSNAGVQASAFTKVSGSSAGREPPVRASRSATGSAGSRRPGGRPSPRAQTARSSRTTETAWVPVSRRSSDR
jgi:hypothetical protein